MKILFLCGSLEPGKDGVGDYTRRLAGELIRVGHDCKIIALNDSYISNILEETHYVDDIAIEVLRLNRDNSWKIRMKTAHKFVNEFDSEWVSLQFVPYSFHDKGLPYSLVNELKKIGKGKSWHIMFHELWLGINIESTLKHKIWGQFQQLIIQRLLTFLKPKVIHTQSNVYKDCLQTLNVEARQLKLFSNIPKSNAFLSKIDSDFTCIIFGSIHASGPINSFVRELLKFSQDFNRTLKFTFVGRNGPSLSDWTSILTIHGVQYEIIGEVSGEQISSCLTSADIGISTTPYWLSEKSGTFAAMLDHNLPVLSVSYLWTPRITKNLSELEGILLYKEGCLIELITKTKKTTALRDVNTIAQQFISDLS